MRQCCECPPLHPLCSPTPSPHAHYSVNTMSATPARCVRKAGRGRGAASATPCAPPRPPSLSASNDDASNDDEAKSPVPAVAEGVAWRLGQRGHRPGSCLHLSPTPQGPAHRATSVPSVIEPPKDSE